jgi:RNA-directed DNA polymerase
MNESKSLPITKRMVWKAYMSVRASNGSAGVDNESLEDFAADLYNNLYKLWNRLTSGSYFPSAVKEVEIPKGEGKVRKLGIPTVSDRIAQMVVKEYLEPKLEPVFHGSSFGYRPQRSAHQALEQANMNCRTYDMVIDLDIQGFFDEIDHELMLKALQKHIQEKWVLLYVERWLKAPVQGKDGAIRQRNVGTPQGGVISPLLANLFLHYCFDKWMEINFPKLKFERYADDIIIHCTSPEQASYVLSRIRKRLADCKLRLNPEKTKIVYCRDSNRYKRSHPIVSFTFLGHAFMPRKCHTKQGHLFYSFTPAISSKAIKKINDEVKEMQIHRMSETKLEVIASMLNPKIRGWINYYGKFRKSELQKIFYVLHNRIFKWVRWKYKQHRKNTWGAIKWLRRVANTRPHLFVHWQHGFLP